MGRATIADIAARAGVSKSTVSHALSGKRPISSATRLRIRAVIDELGYRPSVVAQRLAGGGHSHNIGLVFPLSSSLMAGTEARFIVSAANVAHSADYAFLLLSHLEGDLSQFERMVESGLVDGFILMQVRMNDPRVEMLRGEQIPFVLLGRCASNQGLSFVDVDIEAGVAESLAALSAMGHRTIAYLPFVDDEDFGFAERTLTGFAAACQRHELVSTILPCHPTASGGEAALEHLLSAGALPTALLVRNVTIAEGILRAANRHHLNCPADFSMVVMGSAEERKLAMPTAPLLTVIDIRPDILAMTATQFLLNQLDGRPQGTEQLLVPPLFLPGDSCSPVSTL